MADATVRNYSPAEVKMTFGTAIVSGFADGTFIKAVRAGDAFEKKRGADGSIERINKHIFDFEVELVLKRTSPFNAVLSGMLADDQLTGLGILPLSIKDGSGESLFFAPQAWIKKDGDMEFSDSLGNITWKFDTGPATAFHGGN